MRRTLFASTLAVLVFFGMPVRGEEISGSGPLRLITMGELGSTLPAATHLMLDASPIEQFLLELDGQPPDWRVVYGHGHEDPGLDERLFTLNRERDAKREGRPALSWLVSFAWVGELSAYDVGRAGFPVAIGPRFIKTSWGLVRFKPEEAPGNLLVTMDASQRKQFQEQLAQNGTVEFDVVMTGRLVPEESLVYDFSHDEEGLGLIMPFVRIEQVDFVFLQRTPPVTRPTLP